MIVPVYYTKTVQRGKNKRSLAECEKRIREIAINPKSSYFKALQEGRIQVHHDAGAYTPRFHVVALHVEDELNIEGNLTCGECSGKYFSTKKDYLCSDCRAKLTD